MPRAKKCILCSESDTNNYTLSFFAFPIDPQSKSVWCKELSLHLKKLPVRPFICQNHFSIDQFTSRSRIRLKKNAVPNAKQKKLSKHGLTRSENKLYRHILPSSAIPVSYDKFNLEMTESHTIIA
jgi:hypothetical protein